MKLLDNRLFGDFFAECAFEYVTPIFGVLFYALPNMIYLLFSMAKLSFPVQILIWKMFYLPSCLSPSKGDKQMSKSI